MGLRFPVGSRLAVVVAFLALRGAAIAVFFLTDLVARGAALGDLLIYDGWLREMRATGTVPAADTWMYPPGAAVLIAIPGDLPLLYFPAFLAVAGVIDVAVLLMMLLKGRHIAGAWVWALLPPLLGVVVWARLDIAAVAAVVVALLWAADRPRLAGVATAVGAAIKAWPVLLVAVLWRNRPWLVSGAVAGGVMILLSLLAPGAFDFVGRLASRGLQVESVLATPWLVAQAFGATVESGSANGSVEILEPGAGAVAAVGGVLAAAAVAAAWWVSRRWAPAVRWWAMVVALLAGSSLLSVQFLLWIVGATAVAAAVPGEHGRPVRRTLPLVVAVMVLSGLAFPWQWEGLIGNGGDVGNALGAATVALRNLALVGLVVWSWLLLWPGPREPVDAADEDDDSAAAGHVIEDPMSEDAGSGTAVTARG